MHKDSVLEGHQMYLKVVILDVKVRQLTKVATCVENSENLATSAMQADIEKVKPRRHAELISIYTSHTSHFLNQGSFVVRCSSACLSTMRQRHKLYKHSNITMP